MSSNLTKTISYIKWDILYYSTKQKIVSDYYAQVHGNKPD